MEHYRFSSIEQFRNIVQEVKHIAQYVGKDENGNPIMNRDANLPTLKFMGSVKIHGTNCGVVLTHDGEFYAQSRERILSLGSDNYGFCMYAMHNKEKFIEFLSPYISDDVKAVVLYSEWAGQGIQNNVAISELPKSSYVFGLKIIREDDTNYWVDRSELMKFHDASINLFPVDLFKTWEIDIDFNNPEYAQNEMVNITQEIEQECPVGKYFGVSGVGEGAVWVNREHGLILKIKGSKHSASKVKVLASVDVERIESVKEFVEYAVTENRLEQGITVMKENGSEPSNKTIGIFLKWINTDVIKEESDTIVANEFDVKMVAKYVSNKAKNWFMGKYF